MEIRDAQQPRPALELKVIKCQSRAAVLGHVHREAKAASLLGEEKEAGAKRKAETRPCGPGDTDRVTSVPRASRPWARALLSPTVPLSLDPVRQSHTLRMHPLCAS